MKSLRFFFATWHNLDGDVTRRRAPHEACVAR
jgi:hypothetical protein